MLKAKSLKHDLQINYFKIKKMRSSTKSRFALLNHVVKITLILISI